MNRLNPKAGQFNEGVGLVLYVLDDGRKVYKVPEKKWLLKGKSELEVDCLYCDQATRFFEEADIPSTHPGQCDHLLGLRQPIRKVRIKSRVSKMELPLQGLRG